jgi:hypothetical protein
MLRAKSLVRPHSDANSVLTVSGVDNMLLLTCVFCVLATSYVISGQSRMYCILCVLCACRDLALIFGGLMQLSVLLPTLRHFRIINILGLLGTTFTAW